MTPTRTSKHYLDRHFSVVAVAICVISGLGFAGLYLQKVGSITLPGVITNQVNELLDGNRAAVYGTLASIAGSLLGFAIAVISIVLSLSENSRLRRLKESSQYKVLWQTLSRTTKALGVATLISLGCLLLDRDTSSNPVFVAALVPALVYVVLYLGRTLWILDRIIDLVTMPSAARVSDAPKPVLRSP